MGEQFGPYVVYEQIGMGGMASVHRAEAQGIAGFTRPVALKRMLPHVAANEELVKSFVREARLASHLRHENVAQTYELGKVDDIYFIAMELVEGRTLRALLRQCSKIGAMPLPIALNLINQICDALDYAHNLCDETGQKLGIIHRDVSPTNIIVSDGGVAKLIDFGIAKASGLGMQTMSGLIKGKFGYMAPEYLEGRIDARADLFALGAIAFEVLANKPLFLAGDDMSTLNNLREMPIRPPSTVNPQVPREVDDIIMTALQRDPDRRWQQATALRTAMTTVTKRLGLVVMNSQVVDWIDWAFRQTDDAATTRNVADEPSISIERMTQATEPSSMWNAPTTPRSPPAAPQRSSGVHSTAPTQMKTLAYVPALRHPPSAPPQLAMSSSEIVRPSAQIAASAVSAVSAVETTEPVRVPRDQPSTVGVWIAVLLVLLLAAGITYVVYFS